MRLFFLSFVSLFFTFTSVLAQLPAEKTTTPVKSEIIHLNKASFLKYVENYELNPKVWVYEGDKPCIVDFYTTWCGPCRRLAPVLEELAIKYKGKIIIYKVDTDKEKELAEAFGIRSIPTMLFCPMKGNPQIATGALQKEEMERIINDILIKKKAAKKAPKAKTK